MTREQVQLIVVLVIVGLWALSILVAWLDGSVFAKLMTPLFSTVMGWLFTSRATNA